MVEDMAGSLDLFPGDGGVDRVHPSGDVLRDLVGRVGRELGREAGNDFGSQF